MGRDKIYRLLSGNLPRDGLGNVGCVIDYQSGLIGVSRPEGDGHPLEPIGFCCGGRPIGWGVVLDFRGEFQKDLPV